MFSKTFENYSIKQLQDVEPFTVLNYSQKQQNCKINKIYEIIHITQQLYKTSEVKITRRVFTHSYDITNGVVIIFTLNL